MCCVSGEFNNIFPLKLFCVIKWCLVEFVNTLFCLVASIKKHLEDLCVTFYASYMEWCL